MIDKYRRTWKKVWTEEEFLFRSSEEITDEKAFEKEVKEMLGWDEDIEMEIEFDYMFDDRCIVTIRKRVE